MKENAPQSPMDRSRRTSSIRALMGAVLVASACTLGCTHMQATPMPNSQRVNLDVADVARLLLRAGLTDEAIVEVGPAFRDAMSMHGAAEVSVEKTTEALFAYHSPYVHGASRSRGSFLYHVEKRAFR